MTDIDQVETLIDSSGLIDVVSHMVGICGEKSEHLASNWQDVEGQKYWNQRAQILNSAEARLRNLRDKFGAPY